MDVRADLHVHTAHSADGREAVRRVVRHAKKIGLGAIAITDHNVVSAWNEALEQGKIDGIIVIRGEEVSSSEGHILAYGIHERIRKGMSPEETVEVIHDQGGVAVAAHPYRSSNGIGPDAVRKVDFDAVETLNFGSSAGQNRKAERLARELGLPMVGGSDAHTLEDIGKAYTVFIDVESEDDILGEMRRGNTEPGGSSQTTMAMLSHGKRKLTKWAKRGFRRI